MDTPVSIHPFVVVVQEKHQTSTLLKKKDTKKQAYAGKLCFKAWLLVWAGLNRSWAGYKMVMSWFKQLAPAQDQLKPAHDQLRAHSNQLPYFNRVAVHD